MSENVASAKQFSSQALTQIWRLASSPQVQAGLLLALAALALVSTVIPQVPDQLIGDQIATARWLASHVPTQEVIGRIVTALGLSHILGGTVWRLLCGLLFISLTVQLADLLPARWRLWREGPPEEEGVMHTETLDLPLEEALRVLQRWLHGHTERIEEAKEVVLTRQHGRVSLWAWPLVLFGGALLLAGLWISVQASWHETNVFLPPGRTIRIGHVPALAMELAVTSPLQLKLNTSQGEKLLPLAKHRPARWDGVRFHLIDQPPALVIQAHTSDGRALQLQPLDGDPQAEITLAFREAQTEKGFAVPKAGTVFRLVSFNHLPDDPSSGPALLVQAFEADQSDPIYSDFLTSDAEVDIGGVRYTFRLSRAARLTVVQDPGYPIALAGSLFMCLGCLLMLLRPYKAWRARLRATRAGTQVTWRMFGLEGISPHLMMLQALREKPTWRDLTRVKASMALSVFMMVALTLSLWWNQRNTGWYWAREPEWIILLTLTLVALAGLAWRRSTLMETRAYERGE
ncbi:MAG TPA: cytochrome c biogenesis protein ResB [Caldilineae bacterium]|nr:cytochrome c biogenesis protein ResB [Caldilineae bacterium]